jgi:hypothetical protein
LVAFCETFWGFLIAFTNPPPPLNHSFILDHNPLSVKTTRSYGPWPSRFLREKQVKSRMVKVKSQSRTKLTVLQGDRFTFAFCTLRFAF